VLHAWWQCLHEQTEQRIGGGIRNKSRMQRNAEMKIKSHKLVEYLFSQCLRHDRLGVNLGRIQGWNVANRLIAQNQRQFRPA